MDLDELKALGLKSATLHGHVMGPFRASYGRELARCTVCHANLLIDESRSYGGAQIEGSTVSLKCSGVNHERV